jgi:hypothetical protein
MRHMRDTAEKHTRVDASWCCNYGPARVRCLWRTLESMDISLMTAPVVAPVTPAQLAALAEAKSWPFEEARRLIDRLDRMPDGKTKTVIFETGYGPSGLPHIGTFGEVARTTMVQHAFNVLTDGRRKSRLICFSDDMDGLRKVPDNVPNKDMLAAHLDTPLTRVPDPFTNEYPSFAAHNNARLRKFLDQFGFSYEFFSATEVYASGAMDATLLGMLAAYDRVMDIILPTLGPERRGFCQSVRPRKKFFMCPWSSAMWRLAPLSTSIRRPAKKLKPKSPAAPLSANGKPTGPCGGPRSVSITKWPVRT